MVKKVTHFNFFLFILVLSAKSWAADFELVRNLNQECLIFNDESNSLLPVIDKSSKTNTLYLKILASDILNHKLLIDAKQDFYIYVNSKIVLGAKKGSLWVDPQSFIKKDFNGDHIFLSIYAIDAINSISISLYRTSFSECNLQSLKKINTMSSSNSIISDAPEKNKYIIGVIFTLLTFMILKAFVPNIYQRIFKLQVDMNSLVDRSSSKLTYFQNESVFIFLFISILAGIYMSVFLDKDAYISGFQIFNKAKEGNLFIYGFVGTFILFFLKYVIYTLVSYVFGVRAFAKILINEFSKTIFQSILFIYPLYFIIFSPYYNFEDNYMVKFVYPIILVLSIFIVKELYYFYHLFNSNKFYIIAYICICDLFPTCVFLKILSQSEFI